MRQRQVLLVGAALAVVAALTVTGVTIAAMLKVTDRPTSSEHDTISTDSPVEAIIDLSAFGKERWRTTLGPDCNMEEVPLLVLGRNVQGYDVVTLPGRCKINRFTLAPQDGALRTEDPLTRED